PASGHGALSADRSGGTPNRPSGASSTGERTSPAVASSTLCTGNLERNRLKMTTFIINYHYLPPTEDGAIGGKLHDDVHIGGRVDDLVEADDVAVLHPLQDGHLLLEEGAQYGLAA